MLALSKQSATIGVRYSHTLQADIRARQYTRIFCARKKAQHSSMDGCRVSVRPRSRLVRDVSTRSPLLVGFTHKKYKEGIPMPTQSHPSTTQPLQLFSDLVNENETLQAQITELETERDRYQSKAFKFEDLLINIKAIAVNLQDYTLIEDDVATHKDSPFGQYIIIQKTIVEPINDAVGGEV